MNRSRQWIEDEVLVDVELRLRSHFVYRSVQLQELRVRQFESMLERVAGRMKRKVPAGFAGHLDVGPEYPGNLFQMGEIENPIDRAPVRLELICRHVKTPRVQLVAGHQDVRTFIEHRDFSRLMPG